MNERLPSRKALRLPGWSYDGAGIYFITICTKDRRKLFCDIVGASCARPPKVILFPAGEIVRRELQRWNDCYHGVSIKKYVIMPNHLHLLLHIDTDPDGRAQLDPTVSHMIQQFKGAVSKSLGERIWQRSFHDHVVRNEQDYLELWQYIENNPAKWAEDRYYDD